MAPQNTPPNPPDPNTTNPPAGAENGGEKAPKNPPAQPAPPAPPAAKNPDTSAPVVGDCEGVTKGLRKLVTEQYGRDFVILSVGRGKAIIQNARHAFKIETTTGNKLSA